MATAFLGLELTADRGSTYVKNVGAPIYDLSTRYSSISIGNVSGYLADVEVGLNINHTFVADLDIFLRSPDGTSVELMTDADGGGDNVFANFDDEANVSILSGTPDYGNGRYRPEGRLSDFDRLTGVPSGTWRLSVADDTRFDSGRLNSWRLTLRTSSNNVIEMLPEAIYGVDTSANDTLIGNDAGNIIYATSGGGEFGVDYVHGMGGNDIISAYSFFSAKDTVLVGGTGDDIMYAGQGVDAFLTQPGDGMDTIYYVDPTQDWFGFSGISLAELEVVDYLDPIFNFYDYGSSIANSVTGDVYFNLYGVQVSSISQLNVRSLGGNPPGAMMPAMSEPAKMI